MNQVNLSLPLSATALREGSEFLAKLSQLAEVIRAESGASQILNTLELSHPAMGTTVFNSDTGEQLSHTPPETSLEDDVETAKQATVITQETLPPVEYETVVIGVERNPEYTGDKAAYEHAALAEAGWTDAMLLDAGYLVEVTEQRVKPAAAGASAVTPPAPPAPAPAPATPGGAELDADGLPWDERIHSKAAEPKAATGKWKTRKNLPAGYKEQIEAELRSASPAAAPATSAAPAPVATATPPAPTVAPAPPAPGVPPVNGFRAFTQWMMGHINAKTLDQAQLTLACQKQGLTNVAELSAKHEYCDAVKADLIATYKLAN